MYEAEINVFSICKNSYFLELYYSHLRNSCRFHHHHQIFSPRYPIFEFSRIMAHKHQTKTQVASKSTRKRTASEKARENVESPSTPPSKRVNKSKKQDFIDPTTPLANLHRHRKRTLQSIPKTLWTLQR